MLCSACLPHQSIDSTWTAELQLGIRVHLHPYTDVALNICQRTPTDKNQALRNLSRQPNVRISMKNLAQSDA
jgi:hypothetical protein